MKGLLMSTKKNKLHICLVNIEYPKETSIGGIATYQKLLAAALEKKGHKVTVVAGSFSSDQDYYENGIHVIRIKKVFANERFLDFINYRRRVANIITKIHKKNKSIKAKLQHHLSIIQLKN